MYGVALLEKHKDESQLLINREVLYQKYICQFSDAYLSGNELYKKIGDSYIDWYKKYYETNNIKKMKKLSEYQIKEFTKLIKKRSK